MATVRQVKFFKEGGRLRAALYAEPGILSEFWIKNVDASDLNIAHLPNEVELERKYELQELGIKPFDEHKSGLGFGFAFALNQLLRPAGNTDDRGVLPDLCSRNGCRRVFLAHANEDKPLVRQLKNDLEEHGHRPWLDEDSLFPGQNWRIEIPKAIANSDVFIACLSETSVEKQGYVQWEFQFALNYLAYLPSDKIYLIPLRLNDCQIPDLKIASMDWSLRDYQWVDYWKPGGLKRLLLALTRSSGQGGALQRRA